MQNKNYDIHLQSYDEASALQQLLRATITATTLQAERFENADDDTYGLDDEQFTITIAGVQTAFMLGGPQTQALFEFIESISAENFYAVDFDTQTVKD